MRQRRLTAAVLSAVTSFAVAGLFAGPANASGVSSPSQDVRTVTPTTSASPAPSPTETPRSAPITGQVTAVDAPNGTISVATSVNGRNATITLKVGVNAAALVDGVVTTLANIPVGAQVQVGGNDGGPLLRVTSPVKAFQLEGTLVSVDRAAGTISVKLPVTGATLPVGTGAKVTLDGAPVVLDALPVGAALRLSGTERGTVRLITTIEARSVLPTVAPKPTTSEPPKPVAAPTPKPGTSEPPKPVASPTPKPGTSEPPKPVAAPTPKPGTSEPPKPVASTTPKPTPSQTVKPPSK